MDWGLSSPTRQVAADNIDTNRLSSKLQRLLSADDKRLRKRAQITGLQSTSSRRHSHGNWGTLELAEAAAAVLCGVAWEAQGTRPY
eukprot:symbB.v1.2.005930.t1/scaffold322.1/size270831/2